MTQRICLIVLIGLPAAGKSTFCHRLMQLPQTQFKVINICYDNFLRFHQTPSETSSSMDTVYKAQRSTIFNIISEITFAISNSMEISKNLLEKIQISNNNELSSDYVILCDDNHYYRSMRYKLYQLSKANNYGFIQIYFECDAKLSVQRNAARCFDTCIPENIIKQMTERIEIPNLENTWEATTLTLNAVEDSKVLFETLFDLVLKCFKEVQDKKSKMLNIHKVATSNNEHAILHKLDLLLRRRIGDLIRTEENTDKKRINALRLNMRRKEILRKLRERENVTESKLNEYVDLLNEN